MAKSSITHTPFKTFDIYECLSCDDCSGSYDVESLKVRFVCRCSCHNEDDY